MTAADFASLSCWHGWLTSLYISQCGKGPLIWMQRLGNGMEVDKGRPWEKKGMWAGDSASLLGAARIEADSYPVHTQIPMHCLHPSHPCSDAPLTAWVSYQDVFVLVASLLRVPRRCTKLAS